MLSDCSPRFLSEFDEEIFRIVVPRGHYLRKVLQSIPWSDFEVLIRPYYSPDIGRPAEEPVLMLKLEYLRYHHNLSDREVIARAGTDIAFRYFLRYPVHRRLPHPSSLCVFRGRLGTDGFHKVFDQVVRTARAQGIVKDRLRIKDATHVIGDLAAPSALALVAQMRDKLLTTAEPFARDLVEGERVNLDLIRENTRSLEASERLVTRVAHLREILVWADEVQPPEDAATNRRWQQFVTQRDLAHKILTDQEHPEAGDRTVSTVETDARRGKHGEWFDGFLLDLSMDADSELITTINVLPGNGDEAADATELIRKEEAVHQNDIEAMSIDGAGYQGALLRELEDPEGLNVDVYVPPRRERETELFTPQDFKVDAEKGVASCPAGHTSKYRQRDNKKHTTVYRFDAADCRNCPLMTGCIKKCPQHAFGRTVRKTDYEVEYRRAKDKAKTAAYAEVRRTHCKVERKLGEVMNRHGGRRARYRGQPKVLVQQLMACTATNIKRMVRLLCARNEAQAAYC